MEPSSDIITKLLDNIGIKNLKTFINTYSFPLQSLFSQNDKHSIHNQISSYMHMNVHLTRRVTAYYTYQYS